MDGSGIFLPFSQIPTLADVADLCSVCHFRPGITGYEIGLYIHDCCSITLARPSNERCKRFDLSLAVEASVSAFRTGHGNFSTVVCTGIGTDHRLQRTPGFDPRRDHHLSWLDGIGSGSDLVTVAR